MGRSRGARRQPLSDLSPVHLLQNTKSPETLEGAAAFLCCLHLDLFFNTKWRHYTPPVGKLRSKNSSPMTSLGNWVKQYSWSSYQNKDTKNPSLLAGIKQHYPIEQLLAQQADSHCFTRSADVCLFLSQARTGRTLTVRASHTKVPIPDLAHNPTDLRSCGTGLKTISWWKNPPQKVLRCFCT